MHVRSVTRADRAGCENGRTIRTTDPPHAPASVGSADAVLAARRSERPGVAIAHDYLTQRGGAERVALMLARTFPEAPLHTTIYDAARTYPEFAGLGVRSSWLGRLAPLRARHRLAFPALAPAVSAMRVTAEVTICSSSGWAHGVQATGRKIVYCHTPARWLYQPDTYVGGLPAPAAPALAVLGPLLRRWDRAAARSAHRYLVNSRAVRDRVHAVYGIDAEVLPPPVLLDADGEAAVLPGVEPGFVMCVARLVGYKNVDAVVEAFGLLPHERLVVVGVGPMRARLEATAPANVSFAGEVDDATLRWLYRSASALVSASYEDFGLTPVEAAAFGKPSAVLRWGGFLDTVAEGETGIFFDDLLARSVADAVRRVRAGAWDPGHLRAHATRYAPEGFAARLREIVDEERKLGA